MRLREGKWLSKTLWLVNARGRPTPPLRFLTEGFCMTARAAICWESWSRMAEHFPHCPWMCKGNLFHLDKVQIKKQETKWGWGKGEGEHECEWVCVSVCVCVCVAKRKVFECSGELLSHNSPLRSLPLGLLVTPAALPKPHPLPACHQQIALIYETDNSAIAWAHLIFSN